MFRSFRTTLALGLGAIAIGVAGCEAGPSSPTAEAPLRIRCETAGDVRCEATFGGGIKQIRVVLEDDVDTVGFDQQFGGARSARFQWAPTDRYAAIEVTPKNTKLPVQRINAVFGYGDPAPDDRVYLSTPTDGKYLTNTWQCGEGALNPGQPCDADFKAFCQSMNAAPDVPGPRSCTILNDIDTRWQK